MCSGKIVRGAEGEALERMLVYLFSAGRRVVLDLHDVHTIDCGSLGIIITKVVEACQGSRSLEFCRVSEPVRKVLRVTGLEKVLTIHQKNGVAARCTCHDAVETSKPSAVPNRERVFESRIGLTIRDILRWLSEPAQKHQTVTSQ